MESSSESLCLSRQRGYLCYGTSEDSCVTFKDHHGAYREHTRFGWDGATSLGLQGLIVIAEKPPTPAALYLCKKPEGQRGKRNTHHQVHPPAQWGLSRHETIANWILKLLHCNSCFKDLSVDAGCWDTSCWPDY